MRDAWPGVGLLLLVFLVGAAVCTIGLRLVLKSAWRERWLDQPNHRSMHVDPIPRFGGLGLMTGAAVALGLALALTAGPTGMDLLGDPSARAVLVVLLASLPMIAIGAIDDRVSLPVLARLLVQLAAATAAALALAPFPVAGIPAGPATGLALGLVILLLAWFANLYNFMDGADGLAGLMALVGFLTYALLAPADSLMAAACTALAGASAGFLSLNWPPARVFMGDSGSVPLGFLAGGLGLAGAAAGYWPWWTPLGVFLPFVLDASVTLVRRALAGRRIWQAHREHVYQRLILRGWSHRRISLVYGGWMLACSLATATDAYPDKAVSIAAWAVIILCYPLLLRLGSEKSN